MKEGVRACKRPKRAPSTLFSLFFVCEAEILSWRRAKLFGLWRYWVMPSWKIHNKWARKMGLDETILNEVNELIDSPRDSEHDEGRKSIATLVSEGYEVYERYGEGGLKAYVLHHLLDEAYETLHREITRRGQDIGIDSAIELARVKVAGLLGNSYIYRGVSLGLICEDVFTFLQDNGTEIYYDFLSEIERHRKGSRGTSRRRG